MTRASVLKLDSTSYTPHELHSDRCAWIEKNCYIDVWIEVLHAHGLEPMAVLPFTLGIDFEGDQWTFFKPPPGDIAELYGIEVHELNVWRPLVVHALHHLAEGRFILTEADAFFLPDTAGTDYGRQHTKTTIAIETLDLEAKRLGYFHNSSYHTLGGADFAGLFGIDAPADPTRMPLFAEFVRFDRVRRASKPELVARSTELLGHHLGRRPATNPVSRFREKFDRDLSTFGSDGLAYHAYAFATLRQLGASFELASLYLGWLDQGSGDPALRQAGEAFAGISSTAKALVLKGARAVATKRLPDFTPMFDQMRDGWAEGMRLLDGRFANRVDEG